ncbi:MAG: substrate-binding domain-containing protein [Planctomycetota bacterium]
MAETTPAPKAALRVVLWIITLVAIAATAAVWFSTQSTAAPPRVALVTADQTAFWESLIDGAEAAASELGVELTVERPNGTMDSQTDTLESLLAQGYDGIAVSPVDAVKQGITLRKVAAGSRLITVDSDSDLSGRICFVGTDNYGAGRQCGQLVKEALPAGGRIAIVMGPIDKENGNRRRQGVIDELLDRSDGPGRPVEPLEEEHAGDMFTVAATLIDNIDPAAAESNVAELLAADPDIDVLVGLYGYSTPAILRALQAAGRTDVKVVGFDDDPETLAGVSDGRVFATIAQDQFNYGYHTVRLLADAAKGQAHIAIPLTEKVWYPPLVVRSDNVETFRAGQN